MVDPSQVDVLYDKGDDRLTLTACNPKYSARQRLVVTASLVDAPAPLPVPDPTAPPVRAGPVPPPDLDLGGDLDGARGPVAPALIWGLAVVVLWSVANRLARAWHPLPVYLAATPLVLVVLFGAFQRLSQLRPAAI